MRSGPMRQGCFETGGKVRLGISSCLLGEKVRFDGNHKHDHFITDTLGQFVDFVPVCPEVECGLPVPREAMRLVGSPEVPRLVTSRTGADHTERMLKWVRRRVHQLESENLDGFIFKSGSPSSGMERVKVFDENGVPAKSGVGIFARAFMERFPLLPVEDEGRLNDPALRENFIEAIFTLRRWRGALCGPRTVAGLVDFHTRHKLLLLSHSRRHYQEMGRLVASAKNRGADSSFEAYQDLLMEAMRLRSTVRKNCDVLMHILGYFKRDLSKDEKAEMLEIIEEYREGNWPLIVPITLVRHYVRKYDAGYLKNQVYLSPHPLEMKLRNHV